MYYHLEGTIAELANGLAVIDCGGVGYELSVSLNTLSQLQVGEHIKLYVAASVKEDAFDLYGFTTKSEKRAFQLLISVSGVGPKAALSILSSSTPETLSMAILAGDEKALTVAPGIGKKIAQRVIYELKDKIAKESGAFVPVSSGNVQTTVQATDKLTDASAALSVLGYSAAEISAALHGVDLEPLNTEGIIKAALKNMMK